MKVLLIYSSIHHGNTEKIVRAMGESINADIIETRNLKINTLNEYDLIGFGSGIYYGKLHKNILELIDKLPTLSNKKVFVFSTSGQGKVKYNDFVEQKLKEKGFNVVGSFACKGYDTFGPFKLIGGIAKGRPNDKDFQNAKDFAKKLISL
ncbi:flavodoxin [Clostridium beijerinckii]|uniref:Flavodoxin family protein n=1 Tax=Clostridium beijerinckii TaxID=1520 RepID=A0AB74VBQ9_CLOBE|nr:flavodoxin family protein [Clostridium beijerinckii]NRZ28086.1 flavodoxin [Clostridium beijerinckii]NYB96139.1 flavodoxin [Clostridium beijerinckii]OOM27538.1 flavodoxin [Clostridium beijerinckii]QUN33832.1 flavodoxin family protein [Clostridium beijerinckii]SQB01651.1 flavodoxin [Clostridium beijerinckii]